MKTNWIYLDHPFLRWFYPELARLKREDQRRRAMLFARKVTLRNVEMPLRQTLLEGLVMASVGVLAVSRQFLAVPIYFARPSVGMTLVLVLAGGTIALIRLSVLRSARRQRIRKYLTAHGVRTCLSCGFDLRGLRLDRRAPVRCPECGETSVLG